MITIMKEELRDKAIKTVKFTTIVIRKTTDNGFIDYYYKCVSAEWNYWLGRYYPKAELHFTQQHFFKSKQ